MFSLEIGSIFVFSKMIYTKYGFKNTEQTGFSFNQNFSLGIQKLTSTHDLWAQFIFL